MISEAMDSSRLFRGIAGAALAVLLLLTVSCSASGSLPGQGGPLLVSSEIGPNPQDPIYVSHLYRLDLRGTVREFSMEESNYSPAVSPIGDRIAFVRNPGDQLWTAPVGDLSDAIRLTSSSVLEPTKARDPVFAPDGRSIFYGEDTGDFPGDDTWRIVRVWLKSGKRSVGSEIYSARPNPEVSPDGSLLAYSTGSEATSRIVMRKLSGGSQTIFPTNVPAKSLSFSPDGKKVVFLGSIDGIWQVFIARADGSYARQITDEQMSVSSAVFAPEGDSIAIQVGFGDEAEIRTTDLNGNGAQTIEYPGTFVELTEWSRKRLFLVRKVLPRRRQVLVRVFGKGTLEVRSGGRILKSVVLKPGPRTVSYRRVSRMGNGKGRVVFRPLGGLPGAVTISLR